MDKEINAIFLDIEKRLNRLEKKTEKFCSFCHKSEKVVDALIIDGPYAICDGCVSLCNEIIDGRRKGDKPK